MCSLFHNFEKHFQFPRVIILYVSMIATALMLNYNITSSMYTHQNAML